MRIGNIEESRMKQILDWKIDYTEKFRIVEEEGGDITDIDYMLIEMF